MANKTIQYYNKLANAWTQLPVPDGLTLADITLSGNIIATKFIIIKSSNDDRYILCGRPVEYSEIRRSRIIKVSNTGVKAYLNLNYQNSHIINTDFKTIMFTRDELNILFTPYAGNIDRIPISEFALSIDTWHDYNQLVNVQGNDSFLEIYQDRYIWKGYPIGGSSVTVYNYTTGISIDSISYNILTEDLLAMCISVENICYVVSVNMIFKITFNGVELTATNIAITSGTFAYAKQMVIDIWGDLIILTNSGTAGTLLKYSTSGTGVDAIVLDDGYYNLNTDGDGNYFYQTADGTWKILANTAQGQVFRIGEIEGSTYPLKIRNTGHPVYCDNYTGFDNSADGSIGC